VSARERLLLALSAAVALALAVSAIAPKDRITWVMEVLPVVIAGVLIAATWKRFPLTTLLCILIAVHSIVLIVGGHYTYAHVPFGFWLQDLLGTARNPYDKIGHFLQGFVPAMVAREIFVRGGYIAGRRMTAFVCVCVALAVSAVYELVEWWAALVMGQGADEFLGTQGDEWDTQSDMFMALIGSCSALLALSRLHDRQIAALTSPERPRSASTG
jgi:putative membrane protein